MPVEVKVLIEVALISLAGAAVFYITFLVAVDEVRKGHKAQKTWQEKNEEPIIIGLAIAVIIGTGIVCLIDALKNKLK